MASPGGLIRLETSMPWPTPSTRSGSSPRKPLDGRMPAVSWFAPATTPRSYSSNWTRSFANPRTDSVINLSMNVARLAVICDYPEEAWPSMDLAAGSLLDELQTHFANRVHATRICPRFKRRLGRIPLLRRHRFALNSDRLINRLIDYPRHLRQ